MIKNKLEKIYSKESGKMLAYVKKHFSQSHDGYDELDLLQDTFDSLLEKVDVLQPIDNLTAYVYRALRNKIIDLFRKRRLDYDHEVDVEEVESKQSVLEHMLQQELLEMVFAALEKLSEPQRMVFIETEIENKTFKQISSETGVPINTLLSQKRYAVKKLKELFKIGD